MTWAALFAIYAVVLQFGGTGAPDVDLGRRRLLAAVPVGIAAVSVGGLALRLFPDWYEAIFNPPGSGLGGISPEITPVGNFYIVSKNFVDPSVDGQSWRLRVGGLADKPFSLSLADLRALPATEEYVTLECISNNVGGDQMSTGNFKGVALRDLVAMAGPQAQAGWVAFKARGEHPAQPRYRCPGGAGGLRARRRSPTHEPWIPRPHADSGPLRDEGPEVARQHRPRDAGGARLLGAAGVGPQRGRQDDFAIRRSAGRRDHQGRRDPGGRCRVRRLAGHQQGGVLD